MEPTSPYLVSGGIFGSVPNNNRTLLLAAGLLALMLTGSVQASRGVEQRKDFTAHPTKPGTLLQVLPEASRVLRGVISHYTTQLGEIDSLRQRNSQSFAADTEAGAKKWYEACTRLVRADFFVEARKGIDALAKNRRLSKVEKRLEKATHLGAAFSDLVLRVGRLALSFVDGTQSGDPRLFGTLTCNYGLLEDQLCQHALIPGQYFESEYVRSAEDIRRVWAEIDSQHLGIRMKNDDAAKSRVLAEIRSDTRSHSWHGDLYRSGAAEVIEQLTALAARLSIDAGFGARNTEPAASTIFDALQGERRRWAEAIRELGPAKEQIEAKFALMKRNHLLCAEKGSSCLKFDELIATRDRQAGQLLDPMVKAFEQTQWIKEDPLAGQ